MRPIESNKQVIDQDTPTSLHWSEQDTAIQFHWSYFKARWFCAGRTPAGIGNPPNRESAALVLHDRSGSDERHRPDPKSTGECQAGAQATPIHSHLPQGSEEGLLVEDPLPNVLPGVLSTPIEIHEVTAARRQHLITRQTTRNVQSETRQPQRH